MIYMHSDDYQHEVMEGGHGYCIGCSREHPEYVDPDGREIVCESCGTPTVYGLEELLVMGKVEFTDGE